MVQWKLDTPQKGHLNGKKSSSCLESEYEEDFISGGGGPHPLYPPLRSSTNLDVAIVAMFWVFWIGVQQRHTDPGLYAEVSTSIEARPYIKVKWPQFFFSIIIIL